MKILLTLLLAGTAVFGNQLFAQAPSLAWARNFGCNDPNISDQARTIASDASGNVYHAGVFNYTAYFGTYSLTANGYDNMYIAKYDGSGNRLWVARSSKSAYVLDVAVDATGNVYATGYFSSMQAFGTYTLSSPAYEDGFITKLDANGNFLWANAFGGSNDDGGNALALDASGNVYLTGYFKNILTIGTQTLSSATGWGDQDAFLAKLDGSGNVLWARSYGGNGKDEALEVCTDATGNVYTVGTFSNTATFGSYSLTSTAASGKRNVFVAKTDGSGTTLWASKLELNSGDYYYDGYDYGLAADGNSNVYVTGGFNGPAAFGTYSLNTTANASDRDIFLAKLDASGNVAWAKKYGFNFDDRGISVACDASGDVYTTGVYTSTVSFGAQSLPDGGSFVMKSAPSGAEQWVKRVGEGGYAYTQVTAIGLTPTRDVLLSGNFRYRIVTGNDTLLSTGPNDKDGFIMKLGTSGTTPTALEERAASPFSVWPNPAGDVIRIEPAGSGSGIFSVSFTDVYGKQVLAIRHYESGSAIGLGTLAPGVYMLYVSDKGGNTAVQKIIKE